jgi:hypothetical protein
MQDRLSAEAREVMRLALAESEQLGHGYLGDEHVLLGLLAGQASAASSLLRAHGLELASARAELQRLSAAGLMPRSRADDIGALRAVGIGVPARHSATSPGRPGGSRSRSWTTAPCAIPTPASPSPPATESTCSPAKHRTQNHHIRPMNLPARRALPRRKTRPVWHAGRRRMRTVTTRRALEASAPNPCLPERGGSCPSWPVPGPAGPGLLQTAEYARAVAAPTRWCQRACRTGS